MGSLYCLILLLTQMPVSIRWVNKEGGTAYLGQALSLANRGVATQGYFNQSLFIIIPYIPQLIINYLYLRQCI